MATTYPVAPRYRVTPIDNGKFGVFGNVSDGKVGAWRIQFVPDASFVGSIGVVGRSAGKDVHDDGVGFGSIAYRRVQLDGVASDYALVTDSTTIDSDAIILVPASGLSVAVLVDCSAGFGYLYSQPLEGPPAP